MYWLIWSGISLGLCAFAIAMKKPVEAKTAFYIFLGLLIVQPAKEIFDEPFIMFYFAFVWMFIAFLIRAHTAPAIFLLISGMAYVAGFLTNTAFAEFSPMLIVADVMGLTALLWICGTLALVGLDHVVGLVGNSNSGRFVRLLLDSFFSDNEKQKEKAKCRKIHKA